MNFSILPALDKDCHVLGLSQSGETYDTRNAIKVAQEKGSATSGIINVVGSSISRMVDDCIFQSSGPEISVVSTKAALSQMMILLRIALRTGVIKNRIESKTVKDIEKEFIIFADFIEDKLNEQSGFIRDLALQVKDISNWLFLGRGIYYPIAMEAALKMKEVSYLYAEGMSAGFLKHGSLALIDKNICSFFFIPSYKNGVYYNATVTSLEEVKARNGITLGFCRADDKYTKQLLDYTIELPDIEEVFVPFYELIISQLLAYYSALHLKRDIDKPRNLAKSVTVE